MSRLYHAFGEDRTVSQWAEMYRIPKKTLYCRMKKGLSLEDSIRYDRRTPDSPRSKRIDIEIHEAFGESHTYTEWAEIYGIDRRKLKQRLNRGYTLEQSLWMKGRASRRSSEELNGRTLKEISESSGISYKTLRYRLQSGWSLEHATTKRPVGNYKLFECEGGSYTIGELSDRLGIPYEWLRFKLMERKMSVEDAVNLYFHRKKEANYDEVCS